MALQVLLFLVVRAALGIFGSAWWRGHPQPAPPAPSPAPSPSPDDPTMLAAELRTFVRRVNAAGGLLPVGGVPDIRAIEDRLRPLLAYLSGRPPRPDLVRRLSAMIREYLPEAVDTYLGLPRVEGLDTVGGPTASPADDLLAQLARLQEAADQLQRDVYEHDAQQLAVQRRFLDSKFRHSDLDL